MFEVSEKKEEDTAIDGEIREIPSKIEQFTTRTKSDVDIINDDTESDAVKKIAKTTKKKEHDSTTNIKTNRSEMTISSEREENNRSERSDEKFNKVGITTQNTQTRIGIAIVSSTYD
jgi:hypothetical protein